MRKSGILLPVFSLPSRYGIGGFNGEARRFIDFLAASGQHYWQILPMGPVGQGNSPYQPVSCFAGESAYIDPDALAAQGLLSESDLEELALQAGGTMIAPDGSERIDYDRVLPAHDAMRRRAYSRWTPDEAYRDFCLENRDWLDDFCFYNALRDHFDHKDWYDWPEELRTRQVEAMSQWWEILKSEYHYHRWCQYEFFLQWKKLKAYAHARKVEIVGDIPIYAALESSDCWAHPELFQLNEELLPVRVSGAPPDAFSEDGQCWGNPLYDWDRHAEDGFRWWMARLKQNFELYDVVRLDHTRGIESYYAIPADTRDAKQGVWEKGPDMAFFHRIREVFQSPRFIAEDLGFLTPEVLNMIEESGYPGMKILQFAFDSNEENLYIPKNYTTDNSVVYTGTHDNDTTLGWYKSAVDWKQRFASWYIKCNLEGYPEDELYDAETALAGMIELAFSTRCETCIIPMQDWLGLDSDARTNLPGTPEGNWGWPMKREALNQELVNKIGQMTERYDRI